MNIAKEILFKTKYLKPRIPNLNYNVLNYFLSDNLRNYFNIDDSYDITINSFTNSLEITNLNTLEKFILEKNNNIIKFRNKNELLFQIEIQDNMIFDVCNNMTKMIVNNEKYILIANSKIISLTDLKIKVNEKNYFELKNNNDSQIINLSFNDSNRYNVIFNYLKKNINKEKNKVRKRVLNLF